VKVGKQSKLSKIRERGWTLVFGEGIGMDKAALTKITVLVGHVRGRNYLSGCLKRWTMEVWGNVLEQLPMVLAMSRGWFTLIFSEPDDVNWVLTCY